MKILLTFGLEIFGRQRGGKLIKTLLWAQERPLGYVAVKGQENTLIPALEAVFLD